MDSNDADHGFVRASSDEITTFYVSGGIATRNYVDVVTGSNQGTSHVVPTREGKSPAFPTMGHLWPTDLC